MVVKDGGVSVSLWCLMMVLGWVNDGGLRRLQSPQTASLKTLDHHFHTDT
jgi:hypothetical protein